MEVNDSYIDEQNAIEWPRTLFFSFLTFELFLVAMHLAANLSGSINLTNYFDLNRERTIASWFSAGQLLTIGLLIYVIGSYSDRELWPSPTFSRLVGLGFIFLSVDETVELHESISELTRRYLSTSVPPLFNGQYGAWIFVYGAFGLVLAVARLRDLVTMWRHHRTCAAAIAFGFAVMVSGGVIVEIAGYYQLVSRPMIQVAIEEFLEMFGATIILMSVITFFNRSVSLRAAA